MTTIINFNSYNRTERRRGFQPPWHTVLIYKCPNCGRERFVKKNWSGPMPPGAFVCECDKEEVHA